MIGPFWLIKGGGNQEKRILLELIDCAVRSCGGRSGAKEYSRDGTVIKIHENMLLSYLQFQ